MNKLVISCLTHVQCILGEGPTWDDKRKQLFWVDILGNRIFRYVPGTQNISSWSTPEHIGFVIIRENGTVIGGLQSGLHHIDLLDDGTVSVDRIDDITDGQSQIRFNDGMQDKEGNIWACTMDMKNENRLGKYFFYDRNFNRSIIDEGYIVANGPAISNDKKSLYTVETVGNGAQKKGIYKLSLNADKQMLKKSILVEWPDPNTFPDGLITDSEGDLWIGEFGGNTLRCYSPSGKLKQAIPLPAWNITKAAFSDTDENILYVTSANLASPENIHSKYPYTGEVIKIEGLKGG